MSRLPRARLWCGGAGSSPGGGSGGVHRGGEEAEGGTRGKKLYVEFLVFLSIIIYFCVCFYLVNVKISLKKRFSCPILV